MARPAGRTLERTISPGETQVTVVRLAANDVLRATIEPTGIDLDVALVAPGGETIAAEGTRPSRERSLLIAVAPAAGEHVLRIGARAASPAAGRYRLVLAAPRPATAADLLEVETRRRAESERAQAEALAAKDDDAARQEAARRFALLLPLWRELADPAGQAEALIAWGDLSPPAERLAHLAEARDLAARAGLPKSEAEAQWRIAEAGDPQLQSKAAQDADARTLALWERAGEHAFAGRLLRRIGEASIKAGDLTGALRTLTPALDLLDGAEEKVMVLTNMADAWMQQGESKRANEVLGRAIELSASVSGQRTARTFNIRAVYEKRRGALDAAIRDTEAALEKVRGVQPDELYYLNSLGSIYSDLGRFDRGRGYFEKSYQANTERIREPLTESLNGMGFDLQSENDPRGALVHYVAALHASCGAGPPTRTLHYTDDDGHAQELPCALDTPRATALALNSVGQGQTVLGNPRAGLESLTEALAIRRQATGRTDQARSLLDLGAAYRDLGEVERAEGSFREGLALSEEANDVGLQTAFLYRWAVLDRNQGRYREALEKMETALHFIEEVRNGVSSPDQRIYFLASKRQYYELLIDLLLRLDELHPGEAGLAQRALFACEMAKARSLLDLLRSGQIELGGQDLEALRQREQDLEAQRSYLLAELQRQGKRAAREDATVALVQQDMVENEAQRKALAAQIRGQFPRYAALNDPRPLEASAIQEQLLDANSALVEYLVGSDSTFLFVLTKERLSTYRLPLGAAELARQVSALRGLLDTPQEQLTQSYLDQAYGLYHELLAPAAAVLKHKRTLLIAADGTLLELPFEALLTARQKLDGSLSYRNLPYLFLEHPIAYEPSASVLGELRRADAGDEEDDDADSPGLEFLAFADPRVGVNEHDGGSAASASSERQGLLPLPFSEREARNIAELYPRERVKLFLGKEATKENLRRSSALLAHAARIHFATHGVFDENEPERSGLVLSRSAAAPDDDGILRVGEIFQLRLKRADLVTLSACQTGRGKEVKGEGLLGLTRAFLYAGARSLAVSLWNVSDSSTPLLMQSFYRNLSTSRSKADALYRSKRERVRKGAQPYYWAPFILIGDTAP